MTRLTTLPHRNENCLTCRRRCLRRRKEVIVPGCGQVRGSIILNRDQSPALAIQERLAAQFRDRQLRSRPLPAIAFQERADLNFVGQSGGDDDTIGIDQQELHHQGHGAEVPDPIGSHFSQALEPFVLIDGGRGGRDENSRDAPIVGDLVVGLLRISLYLDPFSILKEHVEVEVCAGVVVRQSLDLARREGQLLDGEGEQFEKFFPVLASGSLARSPLSMRSRLLVLTGRSRNPITSTRSRGAVPANSFESRADGTGEQLVEDPVPGVGKVGRVDGLHFLTRKGAQTIVWLRLSGRARCRQTHQEGPDRSEPRISSPVISASQTRWYWSVRRASCRGSTEKPRAGYPEGKT